MTMPPEFEIRREVELPGTPEQVWDAITKDTAAWLFPGGDIVEPREGGTTTDGGTITAWDPPLRFGVRHEGEGGWFNALEFVIEARGGGSAVLRYVHSGIFVDDWDNQYDAVSQHTDFYLHTLGEYLAHFAGRPATFVGDVPGGIQGPPSSAQPDAMATLRRALGLGDDAKEGDQVHLTPDGLDAIDGVVDYARPNFLGIRTGDGLVRFFGRNAFGGPVGATLHLFGNGVDADATKRAWEDWLNRAYG
jgi:hypothetical protein